MDNDQAPRPHASADQPRGPQPAGRGVLVGVCSWTDPTLLRSGWYPAPAQTAEARLRFYATQFGLVEVDSTYYALPSERAVAGWIEWTPDGFVFNVKAYAPLTQHTLDVRTLPPALRDDLPGRLRSPDRPSGASGRHNPVGAKEVPTKRSQPRLYARDMPLWFTRTLWQQFRAAVRPLHEAGKLGAILLQFPPWFRISRANRDYITQIRKWLPDYRLAVEFRHISWLQERSRQQTLDHLADHGMTYVCVDEPQGFRSSVPPIVAATNPALGMVRLHGRNRAAWAAPGQHGAEQSKYRYSPAELNEWLPKVRELAAATAQTHVLFNNCFADNGVSNAGEFARLLGVGAPRRPALRTLPGLEPRPEE